MNDLRNEFIETSSGRAFYPYAPKEEQINIDDIAHALSHLCRFGGHCKFFYSVGQHSILVSDYLKQEGHSSLIQLYGLLHDATEGYMVDIPSPIKQGLSDYKKAEDVLHGVIWSALGLPHPTKEEWALIKEVDVLFQHHEANTLLPKASWADPTIKIDYLVLKEEKMSEVRDDFLTLYKQLYKKVTLVI